MGDIDSGMWLAVELEVVALGFEVVRAPGILGAV